MLQLEGKVAVITGGGSGIGASIASLFAQAGAGVEIVDVHQQNGEQVAQTIRDDGGRAKFRHCDVADQAAVQQAFQAIAADAGSVDILVNSAGVAHIDGSAIQRFDQ